MPQIYKSAMSVLNLQRPRGKDWFRIEAKAGSPTQVHIYDEIGMWGVSAGQFIQDLAALKGDLEIHLNSPGGEVFDGIAIYNALRQRQPVIIVDSIAASIASVIAMAARPGGLLMEPTAQLMIHDGFAMAAGNAAELSKMVEQLNTASDTIASVYAARTGRPAAEWRTAMQEETWYTAESAIAAGLADGLTGVTNRAPVLVNMNSAKARRKPKPKASGSDLSDFLISALRDAASPHAPMKGTHSHPHPAYGSQGGDTSHDHEHSHDGDAGHSHSHATAASDSAKPKKAKKAKKTKKKPFPGAAAPFTKEDHPSNRCLPCGLAFKAGTGFCGSCGHRLSMSDSSGWVQDPDSSWRFDPDGDGDDDSTPEGDSDHDYWSADGTEIKPVPPCPGTVGALLTRTIRNADVDSSPWDASKAWKAGAASDDPSAFYKGICAGRKAGDPSTQDAWALPYKYTPGSPPNAEGVRNALSRLPQTQGLTNKAQAQSTLEGAMKTINPDYDPDDRIETGLLAAALLTGLEGAIR